MVVEVVAGLVFGSMALLADGLHMASHAGALGLAVVAYRYARRRADDPRFSFGTGKVNALAGFSSAVALALFALLMGVESVSRLIRPEPIALDPAIVVAVLGLLVNGVSALILGHRHDDSDGAHADDHNLHAARLHVVADAFTSLLAIVALVAARLFGTTWMDPVMGIVGGALVAHWAFGLVRSSGRVLLDRQAPATALATVREALEREATVRVVDLHVWAIGPGYWAAIVTLEDREPRPPDHYRRLLPEGLGLAHVTVEVRGGGSSAALPPGPDCGTASG